MSAVTILPKLHNQGPVFEMATLKRANSNAVTILDQANVELLKLVRRSVRT